MCHKSRRPNHPVGPSTRRLRCPSGHSTIAAAGVSSSPSATEYSSAGAPPLQPDGGFDALWKADSIQRATRKAMGVTGQQPGAVAELNSMPAAVPACKGGGFLPAFPVRSHQHCIRPGRPDSPDDNANIDPLGAPPSRFIAAADGPAAHLREEGSSVHRSRLDDDEEEELESLQSSLAVAMGRLRPVDATRT